MANIKIRELDSADDNQVTSGSYVPLALNENEKTKGTEDLNSAITTKATLEQIVSGGAVYANFSEHLLVSGNTVLTGNPSLGAKSVINEDPAGTVVLGDLDPTLPTPLQAESEGLTTQRRAGSVSSNTVVANPVQIAQEGKRKISLENDSIIFGTTDESDNFDILVFNHATKYKSLSADPTQGDGGNGLGNMLYNKEGKLYWQGLEITTQGNIFEGKWMALESNNTDKHIFYGSSAVGDHNKGFVGIGIRKDQTEHLPQAPLSVVRNYANETKIDTLAEFKVNNHGNQGDIDGLFSIRANDESVSLRGEGTIDSVGLGLNYIDEGASAGSDQVAAATAAAQASAVAAFDANLPEADLLIRRSNVTSSLYFADTPSFVEALFQCPIIIKNRSAEGGSGSHGNIQLGGAIELNGNNDGGSGGVFELKQKDILVPVDEFGRATKVTSLTLDDNGSLMIGRESVPQEEGQKLTLRQLRSAYYENNKAEGDRDLENYNDIGSFDMINFGTDSFQADWCGSYNVETHGIIGMSNYVASDDHFANKKYLYFSNESKDSTDLSDLKKHNLRIGEGFTIFNPDADHSDFKMFIYDGTTASHPIFSIKKVTNQSNVSQGILSIGSEANLESDNLIQSDKYKKFGIPKTVMYGGLDVLVNEGQSFDNKGLQISSDVSDVAPKLILRNYKNVDGTTNETNGFTRKIAISLNPNGDLEIYHEKNGKENSGGIATKPRFIIKNDGTINMPRLPQTTDPSSLSEGDLYSDNGIVKVKT